MSSTYFPHHQRHMPSYPVPKNLELKHLLLNCHGLPETKSATAEQYSDGLSAIDHRASSSNNATAKICMTVYEIVHEVFLYVAPVLKPALRFNFRAFYHMRQAAMYICHVTFGLSMKKIARYFSTDRSTVSYACRIIEERRDIQCYDELISMCERLCRLIPRPGS